MKYLIISDLHFGKGDDFILTHQLEYINSLYDLEYDEIIILGDVFDKRRTADIKVLNEVKKVFDKLLTKVNKITIICGNHQAQACDL